MDYSGFRGEQVGSAVFCIESPFNWQVFFFLPRGNMPGIYIYSANAPNAIRLGVIHTNPKPPPDLHPTMMVNREDLKPAKTYIFCKKPQILLEGFGNFTTLPKKHP